MTPNKKRIIKQAAWSAVAAAPRKSYLGKYSRLNEIQSQWIKSLLNVWGEAYGGSTSGHLGAGGGFWGCIIQEEWSDEQAQKITRTLRELRKIGYRGDALISMAKSIIWPKTSLTEMLERSAVEEESDFIETIILKTFKKDNPIYILGLDYYAHAKRVSDMGRFLQFYYAPHLTRIQAEDRVRWCIELFNSAVFIAIRTAICIENANKIKNSLQIDNESA